MRVEIHPKVRVREDGRIDVIIRREYFHMVEDRSNQCDAFRTLCRDCPHSPRGRMVERLHHKEALAQGNYWIEVSEGAEYPKECILSIDELVADGLANSAAFGRQDDIPHCVLTTLAEPGCTVFSGIHVWRSLMDVS